jgi:hypothetical protein
MFIFFVQGKSDRNTMLKWYFCVLSDNWHDHRDSPIKPELVLIYRKPDDVTLYTSCNTDINSNFANVRFYLQSSGGKKPTENALNVKLIFFGFIIK